MSLIDTYREKLESQIKEHKAHLDLLKAKARRIAIQSKFVGEKELAEADKHLAHLKSKFNEFKGASGGALSELKSGLKTALTDLKASTKKAAHHFNSTPPRPKHRSRKPAKQAAKIIRHSRAAKAVKHAAKTVLKPKGVKHSRKSQGQ